MPDQKITRLFLVRHGATELSAEDRFAGSINPDLSQIGILQAERLAQRLSDDSITAVYSSPMLRTIHTATILARPHHITPLLRDPEAVREDVLDEIVSIARARERYGVVFTGTVENYDLAVDVAATAALRHRLRSGLAA